MRTLPAPLAGHAGFEDGTVDFALWRSTDGAENWSLLGAVPAENAYTLDVEESTGTVELLAVHPDYQNRGIGTRLNTFALEKVRESGMRLAELGTGGDPGHAPARRSYEKAGYTALPLVRYYKAL